MRKFLIISLAALAFGVASCGTAFTAAAAVVNGQRISMDTVESEIESQLDNPQVGDAANDPATRVAAARSVLEGFIQRKVVRQAAADLGITVTDKMIDDEIERFRAQFGGEAELQARIDEQGWTQAEFRERVHDQALFDAVRQKLAPVSDEQVRSNYNKNKNAFRQVRLSNILVTTQRRSAAQARARAQTARARIQAGESFGAVAVAMSEDPQTKQNKGSFGGFVLATALDQQDPGLGRAALRAPLRAVTSPIRTGTGYQVLLVTGKRVQPFDQAAVQIRAQLNDEFGQEAFAKMLQDAMKKAKIVVNPRYGDWDAVNGRIVDREFFEPPTVDPNQPPEEGLFSPPPVAPPPVVGQ